MAGRIEVKTIPGTAEMLERVIEEKQIEEKKNETGKNAAKKKIEQPEKDE